PATKVSPKEMLSVVDKPLVQYAVEEALAAGIEDIIFVTSRGKAVMEDHFDRAPELEAALEARGKHAELDMLAAMLPPEGRIMSVRQHAALGLGHAVWCARELVGDEPFAVILPDDLVHGAAPCLAQMVEAYRETGGNLVGVMDVPRAETRRYGVLDPGVERGRLVEVRGLVEKPAPEDAPSTLTVIGRYILQPEVFAHLGDKRAGAGGEIQLTDAMARLIGTMPFHGLRFEGTRYDCGDKLGFLKANIALALDRPDLGPGLRAFLRDLDI
ncbi:MAG: UTP--glucose-1-phosphate uridylyltransferase, partial [Sphingomonadales bacterium]